MKPSPTVAWIELRQFYATKHICDRPLVVLKDKLVLDVDDLALSCKVEPGLTSRMAKSILEHGKFIDWKEEDYADLQRKWLDVCLDYADCIEPADQHSAFLDLSCHPDPIAVGEDLHRAISQKTALSLDIGLANSKWIARQSISTGSSNKSLTSAQDFIADWPVCDLEPVLPEHRARLIFLGYPTIGDVATIPFQILADQFGDQALTIQAAAKGEYFEPVQPVYPPDSLMDRFLFEGPVDSSEVILDSCRVWAKRIGKRLQQRSLEGLKLWLAVDFEEGKPKSFARVFSKPIRCARTAFSALRLMLDRPFDRPIVALRIRMIELRKTQHFQPELYESARIEQRIKPALHHLRTVFGDQSIELASQKQEPRRVKVLRMWKHATGWQ
jgi:nucleotidyltransferase/DNA polymerase involved in DNA repair